MRSLKEIWKIFSLPDKELHALTDRELRQILEKNTEIDVKLLSIVCSEILRRTWVPGEKD